MRKKLPKSIWLFAKLIIAAGVITWLLRSGTVDLREISRVGEGWPWLVLGLVPFGLVLFLCACRLRWLLAAQGIEYRLRDANALTMIGHFFNQFLLGTTGGDVVKAYVIAREQPGRRSAAVMTVFVDRVVGLVVLFAVAIAAIPLNWELIQSQASLRYLAVSVGAIFLLSCLAGYVFYSRWVRSLKLVCWLIERLPLKSIIAKFTAAVYVYKFHPRLVLQAVLASVLVHTLVVLLHICLARALMPEPFAWGRFLFIIPLAQIATAVPIGPLGGIGTGELVYASLLPLVGISASLGGLICVLQRVVYYAWALVGAIYYLNRRGRVDEAVQALKVEAAAEAGADEAAKESQDASQNRAGGLGGNAFKANGNRSLRAWVDSGAP